MTAKHMGGELELSVNLKWHDILIYWLLGGSILEYGRHNFHHFNSQK